MNGKGSPGDEEGKQRNSVKESLFSRSFQVAMKYAGKDVNYDTWV